ncbi:hypothetical protein BDZ91DRAFT_783576 [Kalaharituber pfeilii]|nr:hypothetical protein BDZ91DRAFT_783576 [Kalaharituber pfeilii]
MVTEVLDKDYENILKLSAYQHKNIVACQEVLSFNKNIYIAFEFMDVSVSQILACQALNENEITNILLQVIILVNRKSEIKIKRVPDIEELKLSNPTGWSSKINNFVSATCFADLETIAKHSFLKLATDNQNLSPLVYTTLITSKYDWSFA